MNIPMVDPAGEYRELKTEIDAAVGRVFSSGRFVLGPEGEALEREIAQFIGAAHAVGCNSGTDALMSLPGDTVLFSVTSSSGIPIPRNLLIVVGMSTAR
jgi:dTDP-4-amino-4,6-dideoxygalactose transaminase